MNKKAIFLGTIVSTLAVIAVYSPIASADYYDCSGKYHYGSPGPSECHYLVNPPKRTERSERKPRKPNTLEPGQRYNDPLRSDRENLNILKRRPRLESDIRVTDRGSNILKPQSRHKYDLQKKERQRNVLVPQKREKEKEKRYEIRNSRKYCVKDYCYYVYDYCDNYGNCVKKKRKYKNPNYNPDNDYNNHYDEQDKQETENETSYSRGNIYKNNKTWNYRVNKYIYNYYYNKIRQPEYCNNHSGRCIYRGFHFGGYHNGYWHW